MNTVHAVILFAAVAAVAPVTAANVFLALDDHLHQKAFDAGRDRIIAAELQPKCKEQALVHLETARFDGSIENCTGPLNITKDVFIIGLQTLKSVDQLLSDLNTVFNTIPLCFHRSIIDVFGMLSCFSGNFVSLWNAVKHFFFFADYWNVPIHVIQQFEQCLAHKKETVARYVVEPILLNAQLCSQRL